MKLATFAALLALPFAASAAAAQDRPPPRLVVAISVDQFSADLFAQYRRHFTGGLRRLSNGMVFPSGYQSHNLTETCPGHSTILTGSRPARTGIISNDWFDQSVARPDKKVYCSEDPSVPGSSSEHYTVSTHFLKVPALGDWMKRANPQSRSVAVAGKDRSAVMMGGYDTDQRWYWTGKEYGGAGKGGPAAAVGEINAVVAAALARPREAFAVPGICAAHDRAVAVAGGGAAVGTGRFARAAGETKGFRASPELDAVTLELASRIRSELHLGEGPAPDLLAVGVSATDYVGHTYGTEGVEMCIQLMALDRALGDFFAKLDAAGIDYVAMLTADHGGNDIPEREGEHAIANASRTDNALALSRMGKMLAAKLGLQGPVILASAAFGDFYIDRNLPPAARAKARAAAIAAYRAHPQVAAVFTHEELAAARAPSGPPETWSLLDRAKASFDPQRSGDFIVQLKPRVTPVFDTSHGYVAT